MQDVDGHVVLWAAPGFFEVPGGVHAGEDILAGAELLVQVIEAAAGAGAADGPGQPAQLALQDGAADAWVVGVQHHTRRGHDLDAGFLRRRKEFVGLGNGSGHRLVEVDVLAGRNGLHALLKVKSDG